VSKEFGHSSRQELLKEKNDLVSLQEVQRIEGSNAVFTRRVTNFTNSSIVKISLRA
jgi:putative transposon-encoded protein